HKYISLHAIARRVTQAHAFLLSRCCPGNASMRAKKVLTDRAIRALKPASTGKRLLVWDAQVPGLGVRVTDTGQKTFVLVVRYRGDHTPPPRARGSYGAMPFDAARTQGREG